MQNRVVLTQLYGGIVSKARSLLERAWAERRTVDPRWLHYGVFRNAPNAGRAHWALVTLLRRVQHVLAFQILLADGRYPGRAVLAPYDRLPLRGPFAPGGCDLTDLIVCPPAEERRYTTLESGELAMYSLVAISEAEAAFARAHGGDRLEAHLRDADAFPVCDPWRPSLFVPEA